MLLIRFSLVQLLQSPSERKERSCLHHDKEENDRLIVSKTSMKHADEKLMYR